MKWREIKYYAKGTPTKTTKRLRRRHAFTFNGWHQYDSWISPCGQHVFGLQIIGGSTDSQKCKHCLRIKNG